MGLKKRSSASSYLDLPRALQEETWRKDGNCHESRRPTHMALYWISELRDNRTKRGITRDQQDMALALCEICPVQWTCCSFAIRTKTWWHIWGVTDEDRRVLSRRKGWDDLLSMAEATGTSVRSLVVQIRIEDEERKASLQEA